MHLRIASDEAKKRIDAMRLAMRAGKVQSRITSAIFHRRISSTFEKDFDNAGYDGLEVVYSREGQEGMQRSFAMTVVCIRIDAPLKTIPNSIVTCPRMLFVLEMRVGFGCVQHSGQAMQSIATFLIFDQRTVL